MWRSASRHFNVTFEGVWVREGMWRSASKSLKVRTHTREISSEGVWNVYVYMNEGMHADVRKDAWKREDVCAHRMKVYILIFYIQKCVRIAWRHSCRRERCHVNVFWIVCVQTYDVIHAVVRNLMRVDVWECARRCEEMCACTCMEVYLKVYACRCMTWSLQVHTSVRVQVQFIKSCLCAALLNFEGEILNVNLSMETDFVYMQPCQLHLAMTSRRWSLPILLTIDILVWSSFTNLFSSKYIHCTLVFSPLVFDRILAERCLGTIV